MVHSLPRRHDWMKKTLTRLHAGGGVAKDIDNLKYLAENMLGRTFCPLGDAAAMPIISYVQKFREEFEDSSERQAVSVREGGRAGDGVKSHAIRVTLFARSTRSE